MRHVNNRDFTMQIFWFLVSFSCSRHVYTGCKSRIRKMFEFKIWKKPMLVLKQTIHQQKDLDFSFNLAPWKWVWHHQDAATPSRREKHRSARGKKSFCVAGGQGSLMIMPRPLSGCQIKAKIKDFLLMYPLFQYKHWFFQILNSNIFRIRLLLSYQLLPRVKNH